METLDSKEKTAALLGMVIILFVAGALFLVRPVSLNQSGQVAGVKNDKGIFPASHNAHYIYVEATNEAKSSASILKELSNSSADRITSSLKKKK